MAESRLTKNRCCGRLRRNSCPRSDDRQSFPSEDLGSKNLSTKAFPGRFCSIVFPTYQLPGTPTGQLRPKEILILPKRMTTRNVGHMKALTSLMKYCVDTKTRAWTLRQNRKLTWSTTQGSLFSLFRNLSKLEKLSLEANNITAKGK